MRCGNHTRVVHQSRGLAKDDELELTAGCELVLEADDDDVLLLLMMNCSVNCSNVKNVTSDGRHVTTTTSQLQMKLPLRCEHCSPPLRWQSSD